MKWLVLGPMLLVLSVTLLAAGLDEPTGGRAASAGEVAVGDIPRDYLALYRQAAESRGLDWAILAAIGKTETNHGRSTLPGVRAGVNTHGCCAGPMQFLVNRQMTGGRADDLGPLRRRWKRRRCRECLRPGRRDPGGSRLPPSIGCAGRLPPRDLLLQPLVVVRGRCASAGGGVPGCRSDQCARDVECDRPTGRGLARRRRAAGDPHRCGPSADCRRDRTPLWSQDHQRLPRPGLKRGGRGRSAERSPLWAGGGLRWPGRVDGRGRAVGAWSGVRLG